MAVARGAGRCRTLSSASIIQAFAFHFAARLDAEVSEVTGTFAMCTDDFAMGPSLSGKGSERCLEALLLMIPNQIFLMMDGPNDGVRGKGGVVIGPLDYRLQLGVVLAESVDKKNGAKMITIKRADGKDSRMEGVNLLYDVTHRSARAEAGVECFGDEGDLSMRAEVFMMLVEGAEDRSGSREGGDDLVISARDVLKHECLKQSIIGLPSAVALGINGDIRLREGAIEPVCEAMSIGD